MKRICIYPSDLSKILGINIRSAQRLLRHIKVVLKKEKHQFVTKQELAKYLDIDLDSFELI